MLAQVTNTFSQIVLACAYVREDEEHYIYQENYDVLENDPPESPMPTFVQNHGVHQMGFINPDFDLSAGSTPRWTAAFVESKKYFDFTYYHMALQLARIYHGLPPEAIQRYPDRIELVDANGQSIIILAASWL